jgi:putative FmdB family regulatory protein
MPIYEYQCEKCGAQLDVMQKIGEPPPKKCESCGAKGKMTRQVSRTSFVLKGGGWYSDLYGSSKKGDAAKTETSKDTSPKKDTKPDSKSGGGDKGGSSGGSTPASGSGSGGGSTPSGGSKAKSSASAAA